MRKHKLRLAPKDRWDNNERPFWYIDDGEFIAEKQGSKYWLDTHNFSYGNKRGFNRLKDLREYIDTHKEIFWVTPNIHNVLRSN